MSRAVRGCFIILITLFAFSVLACGVTIVSTRKDTKRYPEIYCDFGQGDWFYCDRKGRVA
jgi:hypothetical protein